MCRIVLLIKGWILLFCFWKLLDDFFRDLTINVYSRQTINMAKISNRIKMLTTISSIKLDPKGKHQDMVG